MWWPGEGWPCFFSFSSPRVSFLLLHLLWHATCSDDFFLSAFFSVLCLTASSPKPFPPPGSSSLSCLGPDWSSSSGSPWPALASGPNSRTRVTLLPPFLSDQAQQVQALGTFYLFCQATGKSCVSVNIFLLCPYYPLLPWLCLRSSCLLPGIDPEVNCLHHEATAAIQQGQPASCFSGPGVKSFSLVSYHCCRNRYNMGMTRVDQMGPTGTV